MAESLRFDIFAIDRASHTLDKIGDHSEKMGGKLGKAGEIAGKAFALLATAAAGATVAFGYGLKAAVDYQKITAQTGAVLKSTGGAANVSAGQVKDLAEKISGYSGMTREAVTQGENLLLTFTNIHNSAGKGNDIFTRANTVLADMATALGQTPQEAATKLGKALNDPVKGLTSLQRAGIVFSDAQKKVIKHLVDTGQTAKAQSIILDQLQKKFGGSAAAAGGTFAGSMDKLKNSLMDVVVDGLTPLLPKLTEAATWLAAKLPIAIAFVSQKFNMLKARFTETGGAGDQISASIKQLWGWLSQQLLPAIEKYYQEVGPAAIKAFEALGKELVKLKPTLTFLGTVLTQLVLPVVAKVTTAILTLMVPAFKAIGWAINTIVLPVLQAMVSFWLTAVGAIVDGAAKAFGWVPGIGGKLKKAASDFDKFRDQVNDSLNGIHKNVVINFSAQTDALIRAALKVGGQQGAKLAQSAHGITHNASGTPSFQGGFTAINEAGTEVVSLPRGSEIHTASASSRMLANGGGTTVNIHLHGVTDKRGAAREIIDALQQHVKTFGPLQIKVAG